MTLTPNMQARLAIVSGGTRGIGAAIAERLLQDSWTVYACYLRNKKAAEAASAKFASLPGKFVAVKANVAEAESVNALIAAVRAAETQPIRALVLNAASGVLKPLGDNTQKHWDWTMNINAWGSVQLAQAARPHMAAGSAIVAISSPGAVAAIPNYGAVGVSKAAIEAAIRQLAFEWAPAGIRANIVRAGLVPTEALDHFPNRADMEAATLARTPLGRLVQPADVANAAAFLLSDAANAITGATLVIDGGASLNAGI